MNEVSLLQQHVQSLLNQLAMLEGWLDHEAIAAQMRRPVRDSFRQEIKQQRAPLEMLALRLPRAGLDMPASWTTLRQSRAACQFFFRQYLAMLQGALSRNEGMDGGLCPVADALLDEISRRCGLAWDRFTILADADQFYDLAGIIRLPFPETTFWTLPQAAREFGYFAAQEIRGRAAGQTVYHVEAFIRQEAQADQQRIAHLNDFFADIFATYTLGPAYAYATLLLRLDPADQDTFNHPGSARRAYVILKTLDLLGPPQAILHPFAAVAAWLRDRWHALLQATNQPHELPSANRQQLDNWTTGFLALLRTHLHDEAAYTGWARATRLSTVLMSGQPLTTICQAGDTLTDVLNAAWRCRLEQWAQSEAIGLQSLSACRFLAQLRQNSQQPASDH